MLIAPWIAEAAVIEEQLLLEKQPLTISKLSLNATEREFSINLLRDFEHRYPNIQASLQVHHQKDYGQKVLRSLRSGETDIAQWLGGEPTCQLAEQGLLLSVDELWKKHEWGQLYPADSVTCNNQKYGVPYVTYQWAFYYDKSLFNRLQIPIPNNWGDFLKACATLKANGIEPIGLGSKSQFLLLAWFDYLNLRINGFEFHQASMKGDVSFKSPQIVTVFEHWRELVKEDYFLSLHKELTWQSVMPFLLRQRVGMFLVGGFIEHQFSPRVKQTMGSFSFPMITPDLKVYEVAPTEVFVASRQTKHVAEVEAFFDFISQPRTQIRWREQLGVVPIYDAVMKPESAAITNNLSILHEADGFAEFFDRHVPQAFSQAAEAAFLKFIETGNVEAVTDELERARQLVFELEINKR